MKHIFLLAVVILAASFAAEAKGLPNERICKLWARFPNNGELVQVEAVIWKKHGATMLVEDSAGQECMMTLEYPNAIAGPIEAAKSGSRIILRGKYHGEFYPLCSYVAIRATKVISVRPPE